ncbi:MAG: TRAP transporter large permease [Oscillospiraceae bacterium]|nr:TRAP transporter large permease [Oscillospiraceae bacterium]
MSPEMIGLIGIIVLLVLIALKMWVGAAMALVSIIGIIILKNTGVAWTSAGTSAFKNLNTYAFTVIPMFTLMGMIISESTMGTDLYAAAYAWVGRFKGGLASATVVACGVLGAISGSSNVGVVIMGRVALPEMKKNNYDDSFACGSVAAGAPLSILIPPSMAFITYGIITENSIGQLFMSGIGVGVIQMVLYIVVIYVMCTINPKLGPRGPKVPFKQMMKSLLKIVPIMLLVILVMGGVYAGFFTTTEAGAIGAFGSIVIAFIFRQITVKKFTKALKETATLCGMIFFLIASTYLFVTFMSLSRLPMLLANLIVGLQVPKWVIAVALIVLYFILGMFLPETPMVLLTIPVLYSALMRVGFDPIWLGAFVVKLMAIGSISPPVGMTCFTMAAVTGEPVDRIFKGVVPYLAVDVVILILMIIFPSIATFIPSMMAA